MTTMLQLEHGQVQIRAPKQVAVLYGTFSFAANAGMVCLHRQGRHFTQCLSLCLKFVPAKDRR